MAAGGDSTGAETGASLREAADAVQIAEIRGIKRLFELRL
jgi:hypothetical protein